MKRLLFVLSLAVLGGCGEEIAYHPAPQILPANIKRVAIRLAINKTQQFGIEDRLTKAIRDQFLADGRYPILPEENADGIVQVTVTRYLLVPTQNDVNLVPSQYKLTFIYDLQFIDRASNTSLWDERNLQGAILFPAPTAPGGITEEQAREQIYSQVAQAVVTRVIDGFGTVTGTSLRRIAPDAPSTQPAFQPPSPQAPVNPNPY